FNVNLHANPVSRRIAMTYTRVRMTVDPQAPGKHAGEILVPISTNDSAYGLVGIPVVTLHNGEGPSVLLTGAIHGDEYEGPVILRRLASELAPERIRGTIVILPYCNLPALRAGARVSPLDNLNLNRIFPGNAGGGPSEMLAHF